jgi:hypothetical protein
MASVPSTDDSHGPPLRPTDGADLPHFQFCLRSLLVYTTFLCLLLAAMVISKGIGAAAVLLVALVIAAHVLSTALGCRLRDLSTLRSENGGWRGDRAAETVDTPPTCEPDVFAPPRPSSWHGHERIGGRRPPALVLAGILFGGVAGGGFLLAVIGDRTSAAGIVVGALSLGVVGGWLAFLATRFYYIFRHGLSEAVADQRNDESGGRSERSPRAAK